MSIQIHQFGIAKIMAFFLDTTKVQSSRLTLMLWRLTLEPWRAIIALKAPPGALQAETRVFHAHPGAMKTHFGPVVVYLGALLAHKVKLIGSLGNAFKAPGIRLQGSSRMTLQYLGESMRLKPSIAS
jgi:hypothetical protein